MFSCNNVNTSHMPCHIDCYMLALIASHMIAVASCHISPYVASLMLDDFPCIECTNDFSLVNEIAPIAFSHMFGDFDIFLVKHACLTSLHHIPSAMNIAIVTSYYSCTCASNGYGQEKRTIMMDDVFIYHAHTFFLLLCACVGYLDFVSTSTSRELTIRTLESEPHTFYHDLQPQHP